MFDGPPHRRFNDAGQAFAVVEHAIGNGPKRFVPVPGGEVEVFMRDAFGIDAVTAALKKRMAEVQQWRDMSLATDFPKD